MAYEHVPDELKKKLHNKEEKGIFVGYSDESKAYKLCNPSTKNVIISRDAQFIEVEAQHRSSEKTINVKTCMPHEDKEELTTTSNYSTMTPSTPIQAQQRNQQVTLSINNMKMSGSRASNTPSTPQRLATSSTVSATSNYMSSPSSATIRRHKFKNLSEIYEQNEVDSGVGLNSLFALFCDVEDPIHFENEVKEEKWVATMDEEIRVIEKIDTWELMDLPQGKEVVGVKWVYKTQSNVEGNI